VIKDHIVHNKTVIEQYLTKLFDQSLITPKLLEVMRYGTLNGGKRLRPFLIHCWGQVFKVDTHQLLPLMAAVELIQAYSLIHDDLPILDDSHLRRGKPTAHIAFDESSALLAGSALYTMGLEQITQSPFNDSVRLKLLAELMHVSGGEGLMGGQMLDVTYVTQQTTLTIGDIEHMQNLKTGKLISWACTAPALVAGASAQQIDMIKHFSYKLGLLYQITDDLLDLTGQEDVMGKPICQDLEHNKLTFVALLGVKGAQEKVKILYNETLNILKNFENISLLEQTLKFIAMRTS